MGKQRGLSSRQHDEIDVGAYYERFYALAGEKKGGFFIDAFAGGGRDIKAIFNRWHGDGHFVAIDNDPQRIADMTARENFVKVAGPRSLTKAFEQARIAVVEGEFPHRTAGAMWAALKQKADLILCNAGIMFVPPEKLESTLRQIGDMLAPGGDLVLRFSTDREDQGKNFGQTYFIHDPGRIHDFFSGQEREVMRHDDLPDPAGRPFHWIDLNIHRPA